MVLATSAQAQEATDDSSGDSTGGGCNHDTTTGGDGSDTTTGSGGTDSTTTTTLSVFSNRRIN